MADVRKDIAAMEEEKEQLSKRIERLRKKAAGIPMQTEMLEAARNLRKERDRYKLSSELQVFIVLCLLFGLVSIFMTYYL